VVHFVIVTTAKRFATAKHFASVGLSTPLPASRIRTNPESSKLYLIGPVKVVEEDGIDTIDGIGTRGLHFWLLAVSLHLIKKTGPGTQVSGSEDRRLDSSTLVV